mmetsp:Transcript_4103/g.11083  ORF Transcript_4103/g.11083 Transcript_4103/m.11083 type:complete len:251 (+) Transcript_4103:600-1352(+)
MGGVSRACRHKIRWGVTAATVACTQLQKAILMVVVRGRYLASRAGAAAAVATVAGVWRLMLQAWTFITASPQFRPSPWHETSRTRTLPWSKWAVPPGDTPPQHISITHHRWLLNHPPAHSQHPVHGRIAITPGAISPWRRSWLPHLPFSLSARWTPSRILPHPSRTAAHHHHFAPILPPTRRMLRCNNLCCLPGQHQQQHHQLRTLVHSHQPEAPQAILCLTCMRGRLHLSCRQGWLCWGAPPHRQHTPP